MSRPMLLTLAVLTLALLTAAAAAPAADRPDEEKCEKVKKEIRKVQDRMRHGYSAAEGVRLNEKLLELRKRRRKLCR